MHFCNVHFYLGMKQIRENTCLKQHACWSIRCVFQSIFVVSTFHVFFVPKEGRHKLRKMGSFGRPFLRIVPQKTKTSSVLKVLTLPSLKLRPLEDCGCAAFVSFHCAQGRVHAAHHTERHAGRAGHKQLPDPPEQEFGLHRKPSHALG